MQELANGNIQWHNVQGRQLQGPPPLNGAADISTIAAAFAIAFVSLLIH